jgi:putative ABC transport system permease protein
MSAQPFFHTIRMPLARIGWRNLRRNWRHSLGSMLSIVVGFVAIALFQGFLSDLEEIQVRWNEQRGMLGSMIVEKKGASSSEGRHDPLVFALTREDQAFIDRFLRGRQSEVVARMRVLQVSGLASAGRTGVMFVGWGHDVQEGALMRGDWAWNAVAGKPLQLAPPNAVLLGGRLARLLDCDGPPVENAVGRGGGFIAAERPFSCPHSRVQLAAATAAGQLNAVDPVVAGLLDAGLSDLDARFVLMPLSLAQRLLDTDGVSFYTVTLKGDAAAAARFSAALNAEARASRLDVVATPWREHAFAELYRRGMGVLGAYRVLVILVVVTIAGMSVFTTMLKAVNERVREIGTLRSLGFRRAHVIRLFTLEGAMLALVSSGAGLVVASIAILGVNAAGLSYSAGMASQPIPLTVSLLPRTAVAATIFLTVVAALATLLPARRAARLAIPDALGEA